MVPLLLVLQVVSVCFLWSLNPTGQGDQTEFALFLAIILVSLSIVSYFFRVEKWGKRANSFLLITGCVLLLVLLFAALAV